MLLGTYGRCHEHDSFDELSFLDLGVGVVAALELGAGEVVTGL
jgi:hypothetical protein